MIRIVFYRLAPPSVGSAAVPSQNSAICEISVKEHTFFCKTNPIFPPFFALSVLLFLVPISAYAKNYNFVIFQKQTQFKPKRTQIYLGEAQRRRTYTVWVI
jgi:hypothetical protein